MLRNPIASFLNKRYGQTLLYRLLSESFVQYRWRYAAAVLAMVFVASTTAATAWLMGQIVDAMANPADRSKLFWVAGAVSLVFIVKGLATFSQNVLLARAGNGIVAAKQIQLYDKLLSHSASFFQRTNSSEMVMKVTNSAQMARSVIDTLVMGFVRDALSLVGLVAVMVYQQPMLSLVCLIVGPLSIYGVRLILKRVRNIMAQEMSGLADIIKVLQETSTGFRVVKAFSLEKHMTSRMTKAVRDVERRNNKMVRLQASTSPLMDSLTGIAIGGVVIFSGIGALGSESASAGQLMSFVTAFLMAYEPAQRLSKMRVSIESGMVGVRMMYEILDEPRDIVEAEHPVALPREAAAIRFEDLHFSYNENAHVVKGIDLLFPAGKTTALVGPSGGGKSTLINLILRLYEPSSGRILFGDINLKDASFASLRQSISYVGQDTFLFAATVMENLRVVRPDATEEQIFAAAQIANAHEFISKMPNGYHTMIGENGTFLSGGQRQRLAIARAVLRDAPVLLLDEATSALDTHSEVLVRDAIDRITKDVTTVVIAHRLSTILDADQIVFIEDGRVAEHGTLQELLEIEGGKFRGLYEEQFGSQ